MTALLWSILATLPLLATEPPAPSAEQERFFETRVRPVLVENCQKCHGSSKQWAGLRLDSREALLKGGDSGPALIPGEPGESLLIQAVRHTDETLKMPRDGKLSENQIKDLTRWVELGAPYPTKGPSAPIPGRRDPNHWSFQPLADPVVPNVTNRDWSRSPIDPFILASLEAAQLSPTAEADRRTLIRRLTFDLTGLPPTQEEIDAFLSDDRPDAYPLLVDRLLASPTYGERWGRHWLDVARYADSNGLDENLAHGNAWRYRDYVVAAFNHDLGFDRFVTEQLAGDLLAAEDDARRGRLVATGFLSLGPKVLAEVDEVKMRMDIIDEQIDTVGRAFLGLTLGCARCHDHKFDPIDTADYYGLAGIFKSTRTMEHYKKIAKWHENVLPSPEASALQAAHEARIVGKKKAIQELVAKADEQVRATVAPPAAVPEKLETLYPESTKSQLKSLRAELSTLEKTPPELPSAMGVAEDQIVDEPIHPRGNPLNLGAVVPRHLPPVVRGPVVPSFSGSESGRRQLADWMIDPRHPLTSRVIVNRVWRWHFGRGLVSTPDNFGRLGEPPSHPELLDWLARRFVRDGWSIKALHRLIVISATYRQGSNPVASTLSRDPENRLYSRASVRRLEAEEVRDALLLVGNELDRTLGGSLLKVANRGFLFDHTSKDLTDYTSRRRSLYLPVIRNNLYELFQLLDFPDAAVSNGDRAVTTIAPQALMMLNSEFVMQSADALAARLLAQVDPVDQRLTSLYSIALGRQPTNEERQADQSLLHQLEQTFAPRFTDPVQRTRRSWSVLCQVILASNEFLYVR